MAAPPGCVVGAAAGANEPVGIAERDHGDPRRALCRPRRAIADRFVRRDIAHLQNAAGQFDDTLHRIGLAGRRIDAVERGARPRQIEMRRVAEKDAGRIGERSRNAGIEHVQLAKQFDLRGIERMIGRVGAGEVAHDQRDAVILGLRARRQSRGFVRRNAEPAHAGVDMQRRAAAPGMGADEGVPFGKLGGRIDDRPGIDVDERVAPVRREAVEHIDVGLAGARAHRARFGNVGDKECLAAGLGERRGHRLKPQAIGIGLDHGGAFDGEKLALERAPIGLDRGEIDGQRAAGLRRCRGGCRFRDWDCEGHERVMAAAAAGVKRWREALDLIGRPSD